MEATPWSIPYSVLIKAEPRASCAAGNEPGNNHPSGLKTIYLLFCCKAGEGVLGAHHIPSRPPLESSLWAQQTCSSTCSLFSDKTKELALA